MEIKKNYELPGNVIEVFGKFEKAGYEIYLVGGAVRQVVMNTEPDDWDFTTNATPEQIIALFDESFYENNFGTVGIPNGEGEKVFEITTYRTESGYSDGRRPDNVSWGKTLEEDLKRRDFTINAMAINKNGEVIDMFDGCGDMDKKLIRTVGDAHERFAEDGLRLMRAVRFASQLNFKIEENTKEAIKTNKGLIHKIAKERIRDEFLKILVSPQPDHGVMVLKEVGLLDEIMPELSKCFGVEQKSPQRHHIYDVGTHLVMALKNCKSSDPITRLATLIHDIGKPQTFRKMENGVITFYNHEMVSNKIAQRIADRFRLSAKESDKLIRLVRWHQFTVDEHQTDSAIRRFINNVGVENLEDMIALRVADRLGGGASETSWRLEEFKQRLVEVQKQPFAIKDLKVSGKDVMEILGVASGPKVGEVLGKLFDDVVEKRVENEREVLLGKIEELK
jgi:tRNA nucleotidyltransferase (CCA-adding enzyme)